MIIEINNTTNMEGKYLLTIAAILCQSAFAQRRKMKFLNAEGQLYHNLIKTNFPELRPVENNEETVNVSMNVYLHVINEVNVKKGFALMEGLILLKWSAPNLVWDPNDYDGIDNIKAPIEKIWKPDISVYNSGVDGLKMGNDFARISNNGQVNWPSNAFIKAICDVDMRNFPFDTHVCTTIFGSWIYRGNELSLDVSSQNLLGGFFKPHAEWDLYNTTFFRNVNKYDWSLEPFYDVQMILRFTRRGTILSYIYISPMVLLALMSPFIFLLPYQQSQRFTLGGSLLICLIVLLVGLDMVFPMTMTGLPRLSMYYMSVIVVLLLSMIASAIILNLAEKVSEPPNILKKVLGEGLGCVLFVKSEDYTNLVERDGDEEEKTKKVNEVTWRYIATVLDRFFFVLYVVLTIILAAVLASPR